MFGWLLWLEIVMYTSIYIMLEDGYNFPRSFWIKQHWTQACLYHGTVFWCDKDQIVVRTNAFNFEWWKWHTAEHKLKRKIQIKAALVYKPHWGSRKKKVTACSLEFTVHKHAKTLIKRPHQGLKLLTCADTTRHCGLFHLAVEGNACFRFLPASGQASPASFVAVIHTN